MDQKQFLQEYLRHRRMLYAFIFSIVRRPDVSEDISQQVAMIAFKKLADFCPGTNFGAWLREIARRRIMKARDGSRREIVGLDPETIDAIAAAHDRVGTHAGYWEDREAALLKCMTKLKEHSRRLVELRYRDNVSFSKLAKTFASTANSIQVTLSKIRKILRQCIEAELVRNASG